MTSLRKVRWIVLAPAVIASTVTLLAASPSPPLPACAVAAAWVKEHPASLPKTLGELGRFNRAYQSAIWMTFSAATKRALWQEKLLPLTSETSALTGEQKGFITLYLSHLEEYITSDPAVGRAA